MPGSRIRSLVERWRSRLGRARVREGGPGPSEERLRQLGGLERKIGYTFRDKALLNRALSHRSYAHDNGKGVEGSYERLEFLGDAIVGMIVSEELYRSHPDLMEGDLTKIKSSLVSRSSLAHCSKLAGIEDYLLFTGGSELMSGKSRVTILADSCEALIGALYLDGGLDVARRFLVPLLVSARDSLTTEQLLHSTKSNLLQLSQERYHAQPTYRVVRTTGPEHDKMFTCEVLVAGRRVALGRGSSKKEAEKVAALNALRKLQPGGAEGSEDDRDSR
jgi:ribonuclease-3